MPSCSSCGRQGTGPAGGVCSACSNHAAQSSWAASQMDMVHSMTPMVAETNAAVTDFWKRQIKKPCCAEHKLTWTLAVIGWMAGAGIAAAAGGGTMIIVGMLVGAVVGAIVGKLIERCRGKRSGTTYQQMPTQQQPHSAGMPPFQAQQQPSAPPMHSMPAQFAPAPAHDPGQQFNAASNAGAVAEAFNSEISTPYAAL